MRGPNSQNRLFDNIGRETPICDFSSPGSR
jgi:hypothetical protein